MLCHRNPFLTICISLNSSGKNRDLSLQTGRSSTDASIDHNSMGFIEPFTVTISNNRHTSFKECEKNLYKVPLISKNTPYYLVAASSLEAILTLGDK
jgi:hypothetical protein